MGTEIPNAMAKLLNLVEAANDDVAAPALADDLDGVAVVVVTIRRTFPLPLLVVVLLFNSSGAVAGWQFARSVLNTKRSGKTRHQNPPSETGSRRGASVANFRTRRPAHICRMPPKRAVLSGLSMSGGGDRTGWLGRQDSNHCISESNSLRLSARGGTRTCASRIKGAPDRRLKPVEAG